MPIAPSGGMWESGARARAWLPIALIGLVAFAIFAPTLTFDFVYDDTSQILENPWIWEPRQFPNLLTRGVWSFRTDAPSNYYRPVQMTLYFLDAQIFGPRPFGFHLTNVLMHALVSMTVYGLLRALTTERRAAVAALLFAIHPAHVESVAWIAGSTDVNCALFAFLSLLVWRRALLASGARGVALSAAAGLLFFLALMGKETAIAVPLLALALPLGSPPVGGEPAGRVSGTGRRAIRIALVSCLALAPYLWLRHEALGALASEVRHPDLPATDVLVNAVALVPRYLSVAFFPWRLLPERVFDPSAGPLDPWFLGGIICLALGIALVVATRRSGPAIRFAVCVLFLPLLPVLNVQLVGDNAQTDRYLYMPVLGACMLIVEAGAHGLALLGRPAFRRLAMGAALALVLVASWRTVTAASIWRNDIVLARAGIALEPRGFLMRLLLAEELSRAREIGEAARVASEAATLKPSDRQVAAMAAGLLAERDARSPRDLVARVRAALARVPESPYLWALLSSACLRAGHFAEARLTAEKALTLSPRNVGATIHLASALAGLGDRAGQERVARQAVELGPHDPAAWLSFGEARLAQGDEAAYAEAVRRALVLDPTMARARMGLALLALLAGRLPEALHEAQRATELGPDDPAVWICLGLARERTGDVEGAREAWMGALALAPGLPAAVRHLRRTEAGAPDAAGPPSATPWE